MEGWKDGRMEGWKDGRVEGWKGGRVEGWKDGRMEGWKGGRMEGWKGGRVEGWKDGRMEGWKDGRMEGWKDGRMEVLDVQNLCKSINKKPFLTELTFQVAAGESLILLGENGSGKTLLINILATLVEPTSGTVSISGMNAFSNFKTGASTHRVYTGCI